MEWEQSRPDSWERWHRNWMGLRDSPYRSLQWQVRLKLEVYGHRRDLSNPFHWDHVVLNLPGSHGYRADLPWVRKIRAEGFLAAEIFVYVNDGRVVAHSPDLPWRAARAYVSYCARLGVQDASRKWALPSETPGPWAGTVTHTNGGQVCGMVSQEKWEKTKLLIMELSRMLEQDFLPLQRLLVIRGFLIYVVRTYPLLNPYITGLHVTIDSWRPDREESGFKMRGKELERALAAWAESRGLPCRQEDNEEEDDTGEVGRVKAGRRMRRRGMCGRSPGSEET